MGVSAQYRRVVKLLGLPTSLWTVNSLATLDTRTLNYPRYGKRVLLLTKWLPLPWCHLHFLRGIFIKDINAIVQNTTMCYFIRWWWEEMKRFMVLIIAIGYWSRVVLIISYWRRIMKRCWWVIPKGYSWHIVCRFAGKSCPQSGSSYVVYSIPVRKSLFWPIRGNDPIASWKIRWVLMVPIIRLSKIHHLFLVFTQPCNCFGQSHHIPYARKQMPTICRPLFIPVSER